MMFMRIFNKNINKNCLNSAGICYNKDQCIRQKKEYLMKNVYLDYSATTPVKEEVLKEMNFDYDSIKNKVISLL